MASHPRIILGLMGFGPDESAGGRLTNFDDLPKALDMFQARGYKEVDTARAYVGGKQEGWTKRAGWKERGLELATKVYPVPPENHKADRITELFETSLRELGTDCVDIAYLHAPSRSVPFAETLEAMDKMHKAGKFKQLGLSNYSSFEVAEIVMTCKYNNWVRPTIYQGVYNCLQRNLEIELIPACRRYGLDVVVYSPIAGGLFSGAYKSKDAVPESGRYSDNFMGGHLRDMYFRDDMFDALEMLRGVAAAHKLSIIEMTLRWLVHHSALKTTKDGSGRGDGVIIGISKLPQIDENIDGLEKGPLPQDVVEALEKAWKMVHADSGPYWHSGDLVYGYDTQEVLFGKGAK